MVWDLGQTLLCSRINLQYKSPLIHPHSTNSYVLSARHCIRIDTVYGGALVVPLGICAISHSVDDNVYSGGFDGGFIDDVLSYSGSGQVIALQSW